MSVRTASLIIIFYIGSCQGTNQGYENCKSGTGQQSGLLLQDGLRCLQVQPEGGQNSWDEAMELCNSKQGYLSHMYTLEDQQKMKTWLPVLSLSIHCYIGQKKIGLLNGNYTGYNIRWMTSPTTYIGIEQSYQLNPTNWTHHNGIHEDEDHIYGDTWAKSTSGSSFAVGAFLLQSASDECAICEFLADARPNVRFKRSVNQVTTAPVYDTLPKKHASFCGISCAKQPWCMGFNAVNSGNDVICQLVARKVSETQSGITQNNPNADYYERIEG